MAEAGGAQDAQRLTVRLNPADNVVTSRSEIAANVKIPEEMVATLAPIPQGHKIATRRIGVGEPVKKYNQVIGFATEDIRPGAHVHTHNVAMKDFERDYAFCMDRAETDYIPEAERATFQGFRRKNGKVGTRNYIGVLTSVNCSASADCRCLADWVASVCPDCCRRPVAVGPDPKTDRPNRSSCSTCWVAPARWTCST